MLVEIKDKDFMNLIPESNKKPVLMYFWAPWVSSSTSFLPKVEGVAHKMKKFAKFVSIDAEENINMVKELGIKTIPTVLVLRNGEISHTITGLINESHIKKAVKDHI